MNIHQRSLLINIVIVCVVFAVLWFINFGTFSYIASILLFAGAPIVHLWARDRHLLDRHIKVIFWIIISGLVATLICETIALKWGIWGYYSDSVLGIFVGPAIETFFFSTLAFSAIAGATIRMAHIEDHNRNK